MGVRNDRVKPRSLLGSAAYRLTNLAPFASKTKLRFWLNLARIAELVAHSEAVKLGLAKTDRNDFLLDAITPNDNVLDLGCGPGYLANDISERARSVVGIDHDAAAIQAAQKRYPKVKFVSQDASAYLDSNVDEFNVLVLSHILEHLDNPLSVLNLASRFTRTYIEVPDFDATTLNRVREKVPGSITYTDNDHVSEFDRSEMSALFSDAHLEIEKQEFVFGLMRYWVVPTRV